jgi:mRNA (guanine-N7-)-methyltransferase
MNTTEVQDRSYSLSALDNELTVRRIERFLNSVELRELRDDETEEELRTELVNNVLANLNLLRDEDDQEERIQYLESLRDRLNSLLSDRSGSFSREIQDSRATNRANLLIRMLPQDFIPETMLDIGVGDGSITSAIQRHYDLPKDKVFGTDIVTPREEPSFTFNLVDGSDLPFNDNSFDLITANMVLHHVDDLDGLLQEIRRVLRPNGYLVISEHDILSSMNSEDISGLTSEEWREYVSSFLDIVHLLYEVILSDPQETEPREFEESFRRNYLSSEEWKNLLESAGFSLNQEFINRNNIMNRYIMVLSENPRSVEEYYDQRVSVPIRESRVKYLRSFNNWVKSTLIDKYGKNGRTIDFAGGRGGDLLKYIRSGTSELLLIDLSNESLRIARERYDNLSDKGNMNKLETLRGNIGNDLRQDIVRVFGNNPVDIVSIQFALQYIPESWDNLYNALDNMDYLLKSGGYVIMTIPNAELIRRRLTESTEIGNELYRIYGFTEGTDDRPPSYTFYLEDSIDNIPEYILDLQELINGVNELGWELIVNETFPDYYTSSRRTLEELKLADKMIIFDENGKFPEDNWEIVELYKVLVWRKV